MDLVSIVVAVYNAETTLKKCVDSLLSQTYENIEIILAEDCSADGSLSLCREYSQRFPNIRTVNNAENSGVSCTRNKGIDAALGKYICFVDSDDYVEKDYIEKLYDYAEKYQTVPICGFVYHNEYEGRQPVPYRRSVEEEIVSLGRAFELNAQLYLTALWNKLFLLDVIRKNGIRFDGSISIGEDLRFSVEYFQAAKLSEVFVTSETLYHYTKLSGNTLMSDFGLKYTDGALENLELIRNLALPYNSEALAEYEKAVAQTIDGFIYFIVRSKRFSSKDKFDRIRRLRPDFTKKEFRKYRLGNLKEKIYGIFHR